MTAISTESTNQPMADQSMTDEPGQAIAVNQSSEPLFNQPINQSSQPLSDQSINQSSEPLSNQPTSQSSDAAPSSDDASMKSTPNRSITAPTDQPVKHVKLVKPKLAVPINIKNRVLLEKVISYPFCAYCVLRYMNIRSSAALTQPINQLVDAIKTFFPSTSHYEQPDHCISCCNLLPSLNQSVIDLCHSTMITEQQIDEFCVWISLSISLLLRNRIFPLIFAMPHVELKECVKWLMSHLLAVHLSAKYHPNSQLCLFAVRLDAQLALDQHEKQLVEHLTPNLSERQKRFGYKVEDLINQTTSITLLQSITLEQAIELAEKYRQSANQMNQPIVQINQSITQPNDESVNQPTDQPMDQPSTDQSTSDSVMESTNQSTSSPTTNQSVTSPTINQPINQSINQSINPELIMKYEVNREPILLMGNYCKYARTLSQTPWTLDEDEEVEDLDSSINQSNSQSNKRNKVNDSTNQSISQSISQSIDESSKVNRKSATSVEEEITRHVIPMFNVDVSTYQSHQSINQSINQSITQLRFSSSGREDLDVRMLGTGRPFCLEVLHAKRGLKSSSPEIIQLNQSINQSSCFVQVLNLHVGTPAEFKALKASVESKRKTYRCVVYTTKACTKDEIQSVNQSFSETGLICAQKTPIRVIHRRSALTRQKVIHSIESTFLNENWFLLEICTSAGTYVKEFVHGDRGRTVPSISSMLGGSMCECVLLDVMKLH